MDCIDCIELRHPRTVDFRMASTNSKRILVHVKKSGDEQDCLARFSQCLLEYFGSVESAMNLYVELVNNKLLITDDVSLKQPFKMKHPPFCPLLHLCQHQISELPLETADRGVNVGVAVILESGDGKILLTKRASHLRAFPGIWVPPGGHLEENETFVEAGLREFDEETGIHIDPSQCIGQELKILALWESVYPPKLSFGLPKRHHVVVYLYGKLAPGHTSEKLQGDLNIDPNEVDACAWLDKTIVNEIVLASEESPHSTTQHACDAVKNIPNTFRAVILDENKRQIQCDLPLLPLLQKSGEKEEKERVSTGTKFALEEWIKTSSSSTP